MTDFAFSPDEQNALFANLFHGSHESVKPIEKFYWHTGRTVCDTHLPHSSQALAIDLFGTLKAIDATTRDIVFGNIAKSLGLPVEGPWHVELEWMNPSNVMNEPRLTQVDAKAESVHAVILFEAKFGESDGGRCSQPFPDANGIKQCNGNYALQTNPKNGKISPCALTGKGIRYWEAVPKVMTIEASQHHVPCPFAGSSYQWMRNLTLAYEYGQSHDKTSALIVIYADHPGLPFPKVLRSTKWTGFYEMVRHDRIKLSTATYQEICELAVSSDSPGHAVLNELRDWIVAKIERTGSARLQPRPVR